MVKSFASIHEKRWLLSAIKRQLNTQTIPDRYSISKLEDFHQILKETKIFPKIDLFKAYFQIPISEESKCKTAIITPFGLYEFNVMSFGFKNAPATFQRFIHEVLTGLNSVSTYVDDILIASKSDKEHEIHLNLVLERLNAFGLRINISKPVFAVEEIEFLGYLITPQGSLSSARQSSRYYELQKTRKYSRP
ncbi:Transposon Ty3-I Gag-Pol polyprotein [Araneus ventricosus]|uniref:Transposon Ty3-I Gag-Pol polyprotein n=1 Tax=Araneus ventricosus TaxID=182803 RepID=A0A4Y2F118_ARAVE|nr:Transposon Ty3-I Gag-Pol polyprotein [Araneus ventricosus]